VPGRNPKAEELLADDSFVRWIEGKASPDELNRWKNWIEEHPDRKKLADEAREIHGAVQFRKSRRPDVESELAKLNMEVDAFEAGKKSVRKKKIYPMPQKSFYPGKIVAAILLTGALLGLSYFLSPGIFTGEQIPESTAEVVRTGYGETMKLTFSDGSAVHLNSNSTLTYQSDSSSGGFSFELDGEAWFEIQPQGHTAGHSHSVVTQNGRIEVLGTKFNVNSYRSATEVMLAEGKVSVEARSDERTFSGRTILSPGTLATITDAGTPIEVGEVNTDIYLSWTQNRLRFDQTPLAEVKDRITDIYGVEFQVTDDTSDLSEIKISGSVPNDNLDVFARALEGIIGHSIVIDNGVILIGNRN
jgi:transmembrane sensor